MRADVQRQRALNPRTASGNCLRSVCGTTTITRARAKTGTSGPNDRPSGVGWSVTKLLRLVTNSPFTTGATRLSSFEVRRTMRPEARAWLSARASVRCGQPVSASRACIVPSPPRERRALTSSAMRGVSPSFERHVGHDSAPARLGSPHSQSFTIRSSSSRRRRAGRSTRRTARGCRDPAPCRSTHGTPLADRSSGTSGGAGGRGGCTPSLAPTDEPSARVGRVRLRSGPGSGRPCTRPPSTGGTDRTRAAPRSSREPAPSAPRSAGGSAGPCGRASSTPHTGRRRCVAGERHAAPPCTRRTAGYASAAWGI